MKPITSPRRALLGAAAVMLLQHGVAACADNAPGWAPMAASEPTSASLMPLMPGSPAPMPVPAPAGAVGSEAGAGSGPEAAGATEAGTAQGDVAALMQLIHDPQLVELRTTYNGSYGASLFFYKPELTYYAALFHDRRFWRVIRSQDDTRAEAIYAGFASQTRKLADVEIRRTQLEAQKAFIERVIALSEDRARRLQADLEIARTQQARVDDRQRQMQGEALSLRADRLRAQTQLRELQRQVHDLQREAEAGLPGAPK